MTTPLALAPLPAELYWASAFAAAVFLVAGGRAARPVMRSLRERAAKAVVRRDGDPERVHNWVPPDRLGLDRRRATRRGGVPVPIDVAEVPGGQSAEGVVVDRSHTGLCLASDHPYPVGTDLYLRPVRADADCPWVAVTVRSCRPGDDHHLIGVQLRGAVPLSILLQFG